MLTGGMVRDMAWCVRFEARNGCLMRVLQAKPQTISIGKKRPFNYTLTVKINVGTLPGSSIGSSDWLFTNRLLVRVLPGEPVKLQLSVTKYVEEVVCLR